ncbi:MAG TPA: UvrD-helicase domain-containing protein, partial [Thermoanaerobaculia bacterium]|nr:UvrD-helicase domain-containing protein [Thermoanaerobaculia bacterium]
MTKNDSKSARDAALPDAAARRAIAEELGTTMLVEAAAGTGKTTSLVDRMVALIATGTALVENLSAVTFTIRAAAQLRQRFQNELEKRQQSETNRERRDRLDAALRGLDSSFLGTIHAFCARLLRERPVEARVDPDFREMDEPEDNVARAQAWERFIGRLFAANAPIIVRLAGLGIRVQDLEEAYDALCENSDVEPAIGPETAEPDFGPERRKLDAFLDQAAGAVRAEAGPEGWTGFEQAIRRALRLRGLLDVARGAEFVRVLQALRSSKAKEKAPRAFKLAVETLQEDVVKPALARWAEHVHPIATPILVEARDAYRAWRRQNGLMNFQDLLLDARDLLRDRADVRRALFRRFTPILVDEFQDTDPIQAELLLYLTGTDVEERDWKKLAPAAGSLFVVGDPKQSIYRFRRADVETYSVVRNRIEETGGRVVALSSNFRSTAPLCDWINSVFGRPDFFPADRTPAQAANVPLSAGSAREARGPCVLRLDVPASGNRNEPVIREDAERIGRFIADAVAAGERGPGDFLILFRRRRNMKAYARELERRGVPYEIAGGGAFGESAELAALVPLLEALADPDNPVPFVAVLRGPLFGVDDDALYRFVRAGGRFRFTAELPASTDSRIRRAAEILKEGSTLVDALPPAAAIARLCDRLGLTALAGAEELGESRTGNLLKALAAARKFSGEGRDFPGVVAELTRMRDEDLIEQISVDPGRPRVVRLMSLHGAKGLEAPVVFLADPSWDGRFPREYWIDRDADPPAGHFRIIQKVGQRGENDIGLPRQWAEMGRIEDEFEAAERIRLLYVG